MNYEHMYARERVTSASQDLRERLRGIAHSCTLDVLKMDIVKLTSFLLKEHENVLEGARVGPHMLSTPLMLSRFDDLRTAVREHLLNELVGKGVLNRQYAAAKVTSSEPVVSLTMTMTRIPTTQSTFLRLSKMMKTLEDAVDWKRFETLLDRRTRASVAVQRVSFGNAPALGVWLNPIRSANAIFHNYIDAKGKEHDAFVCDLIKNIKHPHVRMELARAVDTEHQYVLQVKIPIWSLMPNGKVASFSVTLLHVDIVMKDDPEYAFVTHSKNHSRHNFPHNDVTLPFFTFRSLIFRSLIPAVDPDTTTNTALSAIFFILSYIHEESTQTTYVQKLRHLNTFLSGETPHPLFTAVREALSQTANVMSPSYRTKMLRDFSFAFHKTLSAYQASHVMADQSVVSFITPQSVEDSHY